MAKTHKHINLEIITMRDIDNIVKIAIDALEDVKGKHITQLDTSELTSEFQRLLVATGDSNRQVKALARSVEEAFKENGIEVLGVEGHETGEWVLVDAGDIVVHTMLPAVRDYYDLEALWGGEKPSFHTGIKPWNAAD